MILIRYQMDAFHLIWICDGVNVIELSLMYTQCNTSIYIYMNVYTFTCWFQSECIALYRVVSQLQLQLQSQSSEELFALLSFEYSLIMYLKHIANVHATHEMSSMQSSDARYYHSSTTFPNKRCVVIYMGCMHEYMSFQWKCILMLAIEYVMHVLHFRTT